MMTTLMGMLTVAQARPPLRVLVITSPPWGVYEEKYDTALDALQIKVGLHTCTTALADGVLSWDVFFLSNLTHCVIACCVMLCSSCTMCLHTHDSLLAVSTLRMFLFFGHHTLCDYVVCHHNFKHSVEHGVLLVLSLTFWHGPRCVCAYSCTCLAACTAQHGQHHQVP